MRDPLYSTMMCQFGPSFAIEVEGRSVQGPVAQVVRCLRIRCLWFGCARGLGPDKLSVLIQPVWDISQDAILPISRDKATTLAVPMLDRQRRAVAPHQRRAVATRQRRAVATRQRRAVVPSVEPSPPVSVEPSPRQRRAVATRQRRAVATRQRRAFAPVSIERWPPVSVEQ